MQEIRNQPPKVGWDPEESSWVYRKCKEYGQNKVGAIDGNLRQLAVTQFYITNSNPLQRYLWGRIKNSNDK